MKAPKILVLGACLMAFGLAAPSGPTFAADGAAKPAAEVKKKKKKRHPGKKVYMRKTCLACHGKNGKGAIADYPNLAGQDKKYMIAQIKDIMSGKRTGSPDATGNPRAQGMKGALVTPEGEPRLTEQEIKDVSDWLAAMEPAKPAVPETPPSEESLKKGKKLYKKCKSCHGKEGKKPLKGYPYIAGQKKAYIVTQMKDIRDKVRTNGKSKMMRATVKKLKDADIEALADYLSQIDRTAK